MWNTLPASKREPQARGTIRVYGLAPSPQAESREPVGQQVGGGGPWNCRGPILERSSGLATAWRISMIETGEFQ